MTDIAPVVISCGEPSGIGPEVAVGAWRALKSEVSMVWVGDPDHLPQGIPYKAIEDLSLAQGIVEDALPVLVHPFAEPAQPGLPSPGNAHGIINVIKSCVDLVQSDQASALCTAPIHKKALIDGAGFSFPGHTEFLQSLSNVDGHAVMMIASEELKVVPTTIHIALEDVSEVLTPELLRETITITHKAMQEQFGIEAPRIAVAGLNPHAGEGGAMGRQELDWITGLVDQIGKSGIDVKGPLPADTMFHKRARAQYDVAIGMYHDQVLIPVKTLDFDRGVNVTLGLPFIRTSPDHGTAFDIAGKGLANPSSMIEAIRLAAQMASRKLNG